MGTTAGTATGAPRRPSGGRPRLLDDDDVVAAALDLLERQGYRALSMRRLASELLVSLPTVYSAIGSRSHLLVEVLRAALGRSPVARAAAAPSGSAGSAGSADAGELQAVYEWFDARPWLLCAMAELRPGERRQLWALGDDPTRRGAGVLVHVVDLVSRLVADGLLEPAEAGAAIAALLPGL